MNIPNIPRSGNHLEDMYDDELSEEEAQEKKENEIDRAEFYFDER